MIFSSVPRLLRATSFRLAAFYLAIFGMSALVLGIAVFFQARAALERQMTARVETETSSLREEMRTDGLDRLATIVRNRSRGASALDYGLQDRSGVHLAGEIPAELKLQPGWTTAAFDDRGHIERVRGLVSTLEDGSVLIVGVDVRQIDDLERAVAAAFGWSVGLAAVLGTAGGLLVSRAFLRRVDAIGRTAEAIIAGDLHRRIPTRGTGDDLDRLAGTLNRMLDRIAVLMESLRQVSSDVAHDLRTPLSRLYQRLEGARAHSQSVADYEAAIEGALREAQGLLETFSALLRIAQVEGGQASQAGFAPVDLAAVAETVVDAYQPDAEEAGHRLDAPPCPPAVVRGDKELLTQALANLVENALRHTPSGTRVGVRVDNGPGRVVLAVEDDGPGVSAEDLSRLTQRFYRAERSRTTPGNGLGLSLVSAVADLHSATLSLSTGNPGFRSTLSFPAAPEDV